MKPIPVYEPLLDGSEERYLTQAIASGWVSSEGPFVRQFEEGMAARVHRKHGVAVSSGTMALQVAFQALDLPPGSEVILPTFTIISCILAVIRCRLVPVLVDCDPITFNMDVEKVEKAIGPDTSAILMVHTYGLPCEVSPLLSLALKHKLHVIEDAAQMHGQTYCGEPCGSFGDVSIFSFYANKLVTTGEGGMVVTDDGFLADRCRQLRDLDHTPGSRFVHRSLAWNARMTNLQAAVGCAQLERLDLFVSIKHRIGRTYDRLLRDIPGLQLPVPRTDYADNIYWAYGVVLPATALRLELRSLISALQARGIGTRPFFYPLHQQRCLVGMGVKGGQRFPHAERVSARGFYLPGGLTLTDADQVRVADTLKELFT